MSCKEIAENVTYTTELIREIKAQTFRYFILCVILSISFAMAIGYIIYDRYLDSQFEYEEIIETVEVKFDNSSCID